VGNLLLTRGRRNGYNPQQVSRSPKSQDWSVLLDQARAASVAKDYVRAERLYEQAADAAQAQVSRHAPEAFSILSELIHLQYCDMGDYPRSEPTARRTLALREEALGSDAPELSSDLIGLGHALNHGGRADEAEAAFRRAAAVTERALGPRHANTIAARGQLFQYLRNARKYDQLEQLLRPLIEIDDVVEQGVAPPIQTLAWILREQGRWAEAEPLYRRLLAQAEQHADERVVARCKRELADALRGLGRAHEATALYEQALAFEDTESERLLTALQDPKHSHGRRVVRRGRTRLKAELLLRYAAALREDDRLQEATDALRTALGELQEGIDEASADSITERVEAGAIGLDTTYAQVLREYALLLRLMNEPEAEAVESRAAALLAAADARRADLVAQFAKSAQQHDT
jgi:tetratricopeptide (TPR) repeat protein